MPQGRGRCVNGTMQAVLVRAKAVSVRAKAVLVRAITRQHAPVDQEHCEE
jgi:hypothetical protein